jgi:hypothetical protein|tara:strand:+ start:28 stop:444 length:417 start_codon:yes stop_codon:yes gene_type:complete
MTEQVLNKPEEKKKNPFQKFKDGLDDTTTTLIKIVVLGWSGAILTLNYVSIPGIPQQKIDPTFIASVFTGVLASFNISTTSKKGDGTYKIDEGKSKTIGGTSYQTIRVETPIKLVPQEPKIDKISGKEIDPQSGRLIP